MNKRREFFAGLSCHVLLDTLKPFLKNVRVILAINILVNVFNHLRKRCRCFSRRFDLEGRSVLEILNKRTVKTIENRKIRFMNLRAKPSAPPKHLLPKN